MFVLYTFLDITLQITDAEPEFEGTIQNVTYPAGREAVLTCSVSNLGRYKVIYINFINHSKHIVDSLFLLQVGWLRASDQTVLALQGRVVTHNARISVVHEDMKTWRLRIRQLRESDRGCYMCQINASPMKKQIGCIDVQGKRCFVKFSNFNFLLLSNAFSKISIEYTLCRMRRYLFVENIHILQ